MLKGVVLCVVVAALMFGSCKKEEKTGKMDLIVDTTRVDYAYTEKSIPVSLSYTGGAYEEVTFKLSGLPKGMTAKFPEKASSAINFQINLSQSSSPAPGTYQLKLEAVSQSGQSKAFDITLVVDAFCACQFNGGCNGYLVNGTDTTFSDWWVGWQSWDKINNKLSLIQDSNGLELELLLDCHTGQVSAVANSSGNGEVITGKGTFQTRPIGFKLKINRQGKDYDLFVKRDPKYGQL